MADCSNETIVIYNYSGIVHFIVRCTSDQTDTSTVSVSVISGYFTPYCRFVMQYSKLFLIAKGEFNVSSSP